jgi:hypothetical protein
VQFLWLKATVIFLVIITNFSTRAVSFDWKEACETVNIDQWMIDCINDRFSLRCKKSLTGFNPQYEDSAQSAWRHNLITDIFEFPNNEALVKAIWQSYTGCIDYDNGDGRFSEHLSFATTTSKVIGHVPAGKSQVKIQLSAAIDIDLQMFDGDTAVVHKTLGLLNNATSSTINYHGMNITYSGYDGDEFSKGNEYIHISGIVPNDLSLQLAGQQSGNVTIDYQWGLDQSLGAIAVPNRHVFDFLSSRSGVPGALGIRELKFLIKDINSDYPSLYFINGFNVPYHVDFAYDVLDWYPGLSFSSASRLFNSSTYFLDERQHLAGSVLAHDNFILEGANNRGLYTMQMWPTDPVAPDLLVKSYQLINTQMPVLNNNLVYFPASDTHNTIYQDNLEYFTVNQVPVIDSDTLFANVSYSAMNLGEGYGTLRIVGEGDNTPSVNDVVIFTFIPNDLTHVAGIITDTPQTPLSHINLKAKQNNTPNAFIRNATTNPAITPLLNQLVHYQVTHDGFVLTAANQAQADAWLESVRPSETQTPLSDLSVTQPARLDTLRHDDWISYGAKAANVAELAHVLDAGTYPVGYAIPFATYDEFMALNRCQGFEDDGVTPDGKYRKLCDNPNDPAGKSLYLQIQQIMADEAFINNPDVRNTQLKAFRKEVEKSEVPTGMSDTLESIRYFWDPDGNFTHSIRLRSSTNNEDLEGFNGAGLYESNTHHPDEGDIADSVKKVWASLWTARAFEERRFYRIDHFKTYMGVLAHLSYGEEQVNGVAVTKNIYDRNWEGYYVNAQYGELSVTNPEPIITSEGEVGAIPDEFLLARLVASATGYQWVQQYIRHSNVETIYGEPVPTENVLTDDEVVELRIAMRRIQSHFKALHDGNEDFAMDIEFKITRTDDGSRGHLEIKQARPWVD